ncbi:hypothetical protein, variant [Verruconis gallopava]|uniref:Nucleoporin POM33 n=1 Tax=Verruconis gallopava TaxID=253628 RepID=A0A0D1Y1H8_9PEZI|nr:uncharacterized protein PV09_00843 [Verruconis gallopava]XP_016218796.1 hypothetical protein, variant [Verruconis gallopava]KIW08926.1 hypothetical protein PV09_00843 [Verruconis gallopava]KIW08927.1 hypothetical protein, variant [Verruconis gallopava]
MAGPPPQTGTLQERLMRLAQTLQFAWFAGHVTLLFSALRYGLSYIFFNYYSRMARFSYRLAFISACITYGIVVYKGVRAKQKTGKPISPLSMLGDENVQYLLMALVWLFSRQIPLAILPFTVYSLFHVLTYTRANLLPTIAPTPDGRPKASGLSDTIGKFVKDYYDQSMTIVAALEIALWFRLFLSALMFQKGSWILLVIYTAFFRARHAQSSFVQGAVTNLTARADAQFANQSMNPAVRQGWETVKSVVKQAHDATDLRKYLGSEPGAGPKKAQ